MVKLRELSGISRRYDSDTDNIIEEFYIPLLLNTKVYKRIAGFFSSSSLALASRGIAGLIKNGGKMQLIASSMLSSKDIDAINKGIAKKEEVIRKKFQKEIELLAEDQIKKDHFDALAWMIQNDLLEIKIVDMYDKNHQIMDENLQKKSGIFHMKIGIFEDENDAISFSGSVNESEIGWLHSIEEFKVFKSWEPGQEGFVRDDQQTFEKFWHGLAKRAKTYDLPDAIKQDIIKVAPKNFDVSPVKKKHKEDEVQLWRHQKKAIQLWQENSFHGILSMATGSGKTITAIHAADLAPKHVLTIITVPTIPLTKQWIESIRENDPNCSIIECSSLTNWKEELPKKLAIYKLSSPQEITTRKSRTFVITTNATASDEQFISKWDRISEQNVQFIADEVHNLGSEKNQNCFRIKSYRRLGLSATPQRQWDELGTERIIQFFGETIFEYDIQDAINDGFLCHYKYFPKIAFLTDDEFEEFHICTKLINIEIAKLKQKEKETGIVADVPKKLEKLFRNRAKIKKKAVDKIHVFSQLCNYEQGEQILIFCDDTEQMDDLINELNKIGRKYVMYKSQGLTDSQKDASLDHFKNKQTEMMFAIKCLDEGLDIPECAVSFIISSTTSTREFVQRRGRVLRISGKEKIARIYDIVVFPNQINDVDMTDSAISMLRSEIKRIKVMYDASDNKWEIQNDILQQLDILHLRDLWYES